MGLSVAAPTLPHDAEHVLVLWQAGPRALWDVRRPGKHDALVEQTAQCPDATITGTYAR
ncbi:hypothetical protein OG216_00710 [Streptomycetaceae bacterium NBC_01309]